jgi:alkanesulfonate monooxygenase SsuD/methylene tetrahydromethanopterin reductase-like flavin-dependent oxidoreductase (luciferase family)
VKLSLQLPVQDPSAIASAARAMEAAGVDACFVTDHPAPPRGWLEHGGHVTVDPFVALSAAAAVTTSLRVHTHCLIPAYRHPLLVAQAVRTLDALSQGRLVLGVAVGYLEGEFDALGVPFAERARVFEDSLAALPEATVWVGGNTAAAMRRAIAHGAGWSPFPASTRTAGAVATAAIGDIDALARAIERFRKLAAGAGHDPSGFDICFTPFSHPAHKDVVDPDAFRREARELEAIGVTWLALHLPVDAIGQFVREVRA